MTNPSTEAVAKSDVPEMVERGARALFEHGPNAHGVCFEEHSFRDQYFEQARLVIEEMREPTDEMQLIARNIRDEYSYYEVYQMFIDAALGKEGGGHD